MSTRTMLDVLREAGEVRVEQVIGGEWSAVAARRWDKHAPAWARRTAKRKMNMDGTSQEAAKVRVVRVHPDGRREVLSVWMP